MHFVAKQQFSAIQKLKLFSLLKIKEGLKQATEMALPVLMRVFLQKLAYCTAIFRFATKSRFQQFPNLTIRSLLKIKEGLKSTTQIELPILMRVFYKNSLIYCCFSLRCETTVFSNSKVETFFIAEN